MKSGECHLDGLALEGTGSSRGWPIARCRLALGRLPIGYHELRVEAGDRARCLLIVAPARAYLPTEFESQRLWGVSAQLYSVPSQKNWGIGDFGDLGDLVAFAAARGAAAVGLNPLHALFLDEPAEASPYSPNSRLFRNPLYLDVAAIHDLEECAPARTLMATPEMSRAIAAARAGAFVSHQAVAALKLAVLEHLHHSFAANHAAKGTARGRAYQDFADQSGEPLRRFAAFQMLSERFRTHNWRRWPAVFRDCESNEVAELRRGDRVSFFTYLQWLCEEQSARAADVARRRGMAIGLCNDLAVGVGAASFDHWAHQDIYAGRLRVGAPPDPFNERGQEWGVVPPNPRRLREAQYAHFIAVLRANMHHAGALRIDHVMGWRRLFVIPEGASPAQGAYLRFPLDDLVAIAALESHRNRCLIIGEDLGTVPEGFRERMAAENILSTRILYFERQDGRFRRPGDYPVCAAVAPSTHDLPTLRGFWLEDDISAKAQLGTFGSPAEEAHARQARSGDKRMLLQALAEENLLPEGLVPSADQIEWTPELAAAVHVYLARTPSALLMIQLEDLADERHQANLPGSTSEHPNWRRRLVRTLSDLENDPAIRRGMIAIAAARAGR
jgi:4-alpha-glucanotransferase